MDKEKDPLELIDNMVRELIRETGSLRIKIREESENHIKYTKGILLEILGLADGFENLLEKNRIERKKKKITESNVRILYKLLERLIKGFDLVPVKADPGDIVDTEIHRVIETEIKKNCDENIIIRTINPGYIWQGNLLRPAEVKASHNQNEK